MSRSRSPGYPNYSLRKAVNNAEKIFNDVRTNLITRKDVAKVIGYRGISGAADKAIATMMHYGLLDRGGKGEVSVSQTAVDILHPDTEGQKRTALVRAAFSPKLFATLKERFKDDAFTADTLRSFLMRENFLERAINPVIRSYTDTCAYLKQENACESGGATDQDDEELQSEFDNDGVTYGGASVGDAVQWEANGTLQFDSPYRVRAVKTLEGKEWVFVENSGTGIPMEQVIVEKKGSSSDIKPPLLPLEELSGVPQGWQEERLIDDGGEEIFIRYEGEPSIERYEFIRDYLNFKVERLQKKLASKKEPAK